MTNRKYTRGEAFYARYPHLVPSEQLAKKAAEINGTPYVAPTGTKTARKVDSRTIIVTEIAKLAAARLQGKTKSTARFFKRNIVREVIVELAKASIGPRLKKQIAALEKVGCTVILPK